MLQKIEIMSECLSSRYLGQVQIWVILGQKLGHWVKLRENLVNSVEAACFASAAEIWSEC